MSGSAPDWGDVGRSPSARQDNGSGRHAPPRVSRIAQGLIETQARSIQDRAWRRRPFRCNYRPEPEETMRLLHTMIRVSDLEKSLDFYTNVLGMRLLRQQDYPTGKFTLAFVGYGDESETAALELTHNWGDHHYDLGDGYGHIAIEVEDVHEAAEKIRVRGGDILREPGPMNAGTTIIAFVADPDGYAIELIAAR